MGGCCSTGLTVHQVSLPVSTPLSPHVDKIKTDFVFDDHQAAATTTSSPTTTTISATKNAENVDATATKHSEKPNNNVKHKSAPNGRDRRFELATHPSAPLLTTASSSPPPTPNNIIGFNKNSSNHRSNDECSSNLRPRITSSISSQLHSRNPSHISHHASHIQALQATPTSLISPTTPDSLSITLTISTKQSPLFNFQSAVSAHNSIKPNEAPPSTSSSSSSSSSSSPSVSNITNSKEGLEVVDKSNIKPSKQAVDESVPLKQSPLIGQRVCSASTAPVGAIDGERKCAVAADAVSKSLLIPPVLVSNSGDGFNNNNNNAAVTTSKEVDVWAISSTKKPPSSPRLSQENDSTSSIVSVIRTFNNTNSNTNSNTNNNTNVHRLSSQSRHSHHSHHSQRHRRAPSQQQSLVLGTELVASPSLVDDDPFANISDIASSSESLVAAENNCNPDPSLVSIHDGIGAGAATDANREKSASIKKKDKKLKNAHSKKSKSKGKGGVSTLKKASKPHASKKKAKAESHRGNQDGHAASTSATSRQNPYISPRPHHIVVSSMQPLFDSQPPCSVENIVATTTTIATATTTIATTATNTTVTTSKFEVVAVDSVCNRRSTGELSHINSLSDVHMSGMGSSSSSLIGITSAASQHKANNNVNTGDRDLDLDLDQQPCERRGAPRSPRLNSSRRRLTSADASRPSTPTTDQNACSPRDFSVVDASNQGHNDESDDDDDDDDDDDGDDEIDDDNDDQDDEEDDDDDEVQEEDEEEEEDDEVNVPPITHSSTPSVPSTSVNNRSHLRSRHRGHLPPKRSNKNSTNNNNSIQRFQRDDDDDNNDGDDDEDGGWCEPQDEIKTSKRLRSMLESGEYTYLANKLLEINSVKVQALGLKSRLNLVFNPLLVRALLEIVHAKDTQITKAYRAGDLDDAQVAKLRTQLEEVRGIIASHTNTNTVVSTRRTLKRTLSWHAPKAPSSLLSSSPPSSPRQQLSSNSNLFHHRHSAQGNSDSHNPETSSSQQQHSFTDNQSPSVAVANSPKSRNAWLRHTASHAEKRFIAKRRTPSTAWDAPVTSVTTPDPNTDSAKASLFAESINQQQQQQQRQNLLLVPLPPLQPPPSTTPSLSPHRGSLAQRRTPTSSTSPFSVAHEPPSPTSLSAPQTASTTMAAPAPKLFTSVSNASSSALMVPSERPSGVTNFMQVCVNESFLHRLNDTHRELLRITQQLGLFHAANHLENEWKSREKNSNSNPDNGNSNSNSSGGFLSIHDLVSRAQLLRRLSGLVQAHVTDQKPFAKVNQVAKELLATVELLQVQMSSAKLQNHMKPRSTSPASRSNNGSNSSVGVGGGVGGGIGMSLSPRSRKKSFLSASLQPATLMLAPPQQQQSSSPSSNRFENSLSVLVQPSTISAASSDRLSPKSPTHSAVTSESSVGQYNYVDSPSHHSQISMSSRSQQQQQQQQQQ